MGLTINRVEGTPDLKHVDLFAGCGGFSLGLEQAGFQSVFVSEVHPTAMATYLANRPQGETSHAKNRVADIRDLTRRDGELDALAARLRRGWGQIDLLVGGPPCQGFSGIGHRRSFDVTRAEVPSNHLYKDMARVIGALAPRAFVFENVKGILSSRWTPGGSKGEIWQDVQSTFEELEVGVGGRRERYEVRHALVRAGDYGVPQNRPRVLLVGLRTDVPFPARDTGVASGLLPAPTHGFPDLVDLLDDLADPDWTPGGTTGRYQREPESTWQAQMRTLPCGRVLRAGDILTEQKYSRHRPDTVEKFEYMLAHDGDIPAGRQTRKFAQRVLPAQWGAAGPTITATSLPDDFIHYSLPRTPTVREWARLQTFPDWYLFKGNRTTGGRRRAGDPQAGRWERDLPRYTQIGNAVPVALAQTVGAHLRGLLGESTG